MNWLTKNWGKLITILLVVTVGMRILDLMMLGSMFSSFSSTFRNLGVTNDYLVSAMGVACMTVAALLIRHLLWKFIFRRTEQGTLIFGGAVTAWMLLMYFISMPNSGEYFNPVTGKPRFVYAILPDGEIDLKPLGYKYHPSTGEEMKNLTKEAIKLHAEQISRFEQQQPKADSPKAKRPAASKAQPVRSAEYPAYSTMPEVSRGRAVQIASDGPTVPQECAGMRVKSIQSNAEHFRMLIEYKNHCSEYELTLLLLKPEDVYLVSDKGEALKLRAVSKNSFQEELSYGGFFTPKKIGIRRLVPLEVWRMYAWFDPVTEPAKSLIFTHQLFEKTTITLRS